MAARRTVIATSARALGAALTLGAGVAVVAAAVLIPLPSHSVAVRSVEVAPTPLPQSLVCAGSLLQLSNGAGGDATSTSGIGSPKRSSGSSEQDVEIDQAPLAAPDNATVSDDTAPTVVTAPDADAGVLVAAAQSVAISQEDAAGLAATTCAEAQADSWLVGGATTVGRTSFVLLSNPSEVTADVDLTFFTESGRLDAPGSTGITVPAQSQRIFSLAGFAPNAKYPVVHVVSTGGYVAASLQQTVIRGLEPGGVELAGPTAAPSTDMVFAGVKITGTSAIAERLSTEGYADLQAALRVYVPGSSDATITVSVASESSGSADGSYTLSATGGVVSELPLKDLPDGMYSVTLSSTEPIVASARTAALAAGAVDFAWNQAAAALDDEILVPIAPGPSPRIHLANSGDDEATVTLSTASGTEVEIVVPAGGTKGLDAQSGTVYTATMTEAVSIGVGYSSDGQLSAYTIAPPSELAAPIVVYP